MPAFTVSVHGNAFVPQLMAGDVGADGPLTQVDNVPQSDFVGLHSGWGVAFRGKRDHRNWFHVALPGLQRFNETLTTLQAVTVDLTVAGSAVVEEVHLWSGNTRLLPLFSGLALTGNFARELVARFRRRHIGAGSVRRW